MLADDPSESFSENAVVGIYSDRIDHFVQHVAMLADESEVKAGAEVAVLHMGPPIVAGDVSRAAPGARRTICVHIVGDIRLTIAERNAMKNWCAKVDTQRRPRSPFQQYVVSPHMKWERSERNRKVYQRFSCAGFVIECYRESGIMLMDDNAELPLANEQMLQHAYPDIVRIEKVDKRVQDRLGFRGRADLGIAGSGPWPIVLAGYLFHSLKRSSSACPRPGPFTPEGLDAAFYP